MSNIIEKDYLNNTIQFEMINGQLMANATSMAKVFGKEVKEWVKLPTTIRYIDAISKGGKSTISDNQLVISKKGSPMSGGGTWIHQKLILKLAQWLSVEFEIWCDDKIAELLREGSVSLKSKPEKVNVLAKHTNRFTQIENSKSINSFHYDKGGRDKIREYNQKNCYEHTGKFPNELMEIAKKEGIPSKYRTSGKEVVRYYKPHVAASMSLTDELCHKGGMDVKEAAALAKQTQPVFAKMIELGMLEE